jgi:dihydropyrimidine dehydrogenase (NAD+) subunit PreA
MRDGVEVVDHLHSGLAHLLEARGLGSVAELVGRALPDAITPFEALSADLGVSEVREDRCVHCGSCTRCPYLAIELDSVLLPRTDAARCVGCSLCVQRCPSVALFMRPRTAAERALPEA